MHRVADPITIDRVSGRPMRTPLFRPAANGIVMQRLARVKAAAPPTANTP